VPSLDLRFADNKSLVDAVTGQQLVTFTRASDGTFVDSAGVIQTAATDVPRFDHNPTTLENLGLLVEEQRTNSIRNNTMVGAVAGTPGTIPTNWFAQSSAAGITFAVASVGTESGIAYVDIQVSGTPVADGTSQISFEENAQIAALSGQTWTGSVYCSLAAGTLPGSAVLRVIERSIGGSFLASSVTSFAPTNAALDTQRAIHTRALSNALTAFTNARIDVSYFSGVAVNFTLRIGLPQLELGAFATSPILTTTAAVTRSADVVSITGSAFSSWYRQDEGTFYADTNLLAGVTSTNRFVFEANDGVATTGDKWDLRRTGGSAYRTTIRDGGVSNSDQTISTSANPLRITVAANSSAVFTSANGTVTSSAVKFPTGFPTVDRLFIGGGIDAPTLQTNGTIRRLCFWPQRLADASLQQITQ
jgi:hypothetical protein